MQPCTHVGTHPRSRQAAVLLLAGPLAGAGQQLGGQARRVRQQPGPHVHEHVEVLARRRAARVRRQRARRRHHLRTVYPQVYLGELCAHL